MKPLIGIALVSGLTLSVMACSPAADTDATKAADVAAAAQASSTQATGVSRFDPAIDAIWLQEAERRLAAYRAGHVQGIAAEDIFGPF